MRTLAICLDGYEQSLGQEMMRAGHLPHLARLAKQSYRFLLDHGSDIRTGLGCEQFAAGLSPEKSDRWSTVHFDADSYAVWQEGALLTPFPAYLKARTVVFDHSYFKLDCPASAQIQGIVNWGAHDPGVPSFSRPDTILGAVTKRFGVYPARPWIYGTPWNSTARSREMGDRLVESVRLRTKIALWLLTEELSNWDLGIVTIGEAHAAIEGLWHGIDRSHPLHDAPSSEVAGEGVRKIYVEIDGLIGQLDAAFPDAAKVIFSMHGMGSNRSDAASMLLLAEFMYRNAFDGQTYFNREGSAASGLNGCPTLDEEQTWEDWVRTGFGPASVTLRPLNPPKSSSPTQSLNWMPATKYQVFWPRMPAFALPSFYDGRLRINLKGRERDGMVTLEDYPKACQALVELLNQCTDTRTGECVVETAEINKRDPLTLGPSDADIIVCWHGAPLGFDHPKLGRIGQIPYRRTGGHTGKHGFAFVQAPGLTSGEGGIRSSYDVVPTILQLLVESQIDLSGSTLLPKTFSLLNFD